MHPAPPNLPEPLPCHNQRRAEANLKLTRCTERNLRVLKPQPGPHHRGPRLEHRLLRTEQQPIPVRGTLTAGQHSQPTPLSRRRDQLQNRSRQPPVRLRINPDRHNIPHPRDSSRPIASTVRNTDHKARRPHRPPTCAPNGASGTPNARSARRAQARPAKNSACRPRTASATRLTSSSNGLTTYSPPLSELRTGEEWSRGLCASACRVDRDQAVHFPLAAVVLDVGARLVVVGILE